MAFEFHIAEKLGLTLSQLRVSMTQDEFQGWCAWYMYKGQSRELAQKMARHNKRR